MASKVQPFTVTSTPLLANAAFTSIWYDAFGLETIYLSLTSFSDQASAASGVVVQETDDQANANLINTSLTASALASTTFKAYATIRRRFFRIVYTNGAVNQTAFEMTMTAFASIPTLVDSSGNLITTGAGGAAATQVQGTAADGAAVVGNPVLIAGSTSGDIVENVLTDADGTINTNQTKVGGTAYTLGQAAAGSSAPVVLPSVQLPNVGQAAMAASVPVAIASNQSAVPVSGTVTTTPPANASTNVAQVGGTNTDTNSGAKSAGTIRVVLATDQPQLTNKLLVTPDSVALPANQSVNVSQVAGTNTDTNSGVKSAGTLRVVLATDQPQLTNKLLVTPDSVALPANQSVNVSQVSGTATSVNNGTTDAGTTRVTLSSDSAGQVKLATGANTIGALSANQSVNQAQIAGTATSVNNGTTDAGTARVTLSSDSTGQVKIATGANTIGALSANQSVNVAQVNGTATSTNSGTVDAGTQRVVPATNVALPLTNGPIVGSFANSPGSVIDTSGVAHNLAVAPYGFDGTNQQQLRTPSVYKTVSATASGNTAAWTPAGGKKFRLMRLGIDVTGNSSTVGGAVIVISFQDSVADINVTFSVFVPTAALAGLALYTQTVDLGNGFLSAAANNVLNVNLSAALATGAVRVRMEGTEE